MFTACSRQALRQNVRCLHSSSTANSFHISGHGLDKLWQTSGTPRSATEEAASPKATTGNREPSIKVDFDLSDCTEFLKRSMQLRDDADSQRQTQRSSPPHERPAGESHRPEVPNPKSEEAKPSRDFLQQLVEALLVQTPLTSKFGLYRAFLEEYQSAAQGSMGNLVKRLASVAQQQQFQRQQEDLENKNKAIEEQTAQLHAMTADRDKWMLHSQNLLASVKQHGWLTEAQLRAAASVASKRADDEAMYATKKVEELQQKLGSSVQNMERAKVGDIHQDWILAKHFGRIADAKAASKKEQTSKSLKEDPAKSEGDADAVDSKSRSISEQLNRLQSDVQQLKVQNQKLAAKNSLALGPRKLHRWVSSYDPVPKREAMCNEESFCASDSDSDSDPTLSEVWDHKMEQRRLEACFHKRRSHSSHGRHCPECSP